MSIVHDVPLTLKALTNTIVVTCSTQQTVLATTANQVQSSNADYSTGTGRGAGTGIQGRIIDRLNEPFLTERYTVAFPSAHLESTRGSTEANRQLAINVKLQHGNSSAGGDMADYSTGSAPAELVLFTTAQTTPMQSWSTGAVQGQSQPCTYDLRGANRYIRAVVGAFKNKVTTESSGDESFLVSASIGFMGAATFPQNVWTSAGSTTTSTST
jgi:hypothetical protein